MNTLLQPGMKEEPSATVSQKPLLFKALAIALSVLVLHSVVLWWSLTPGSQSRNNDSSLAQLRLQRGAELPEQPQGDLFVKGRERQDSEASLEAETDDISMDSIGSYALLAVLSSGNTYYALFDNGAEQQKLKLGDTLPGNGAVTHIDRRRVLIANPDVEGGEQQFMLFPVLQPNAEQEADEEI